MARAFETIYREAKNFAKYRKADDLMFYKIFRNEVNLEFGQEMDSTEYEHDQPTCVFLKEKGRVSVKEMCRRFYAIRAAV